MNKIILHLETCFILVALLSTPVIASESVPLLIPIRGSVFIEGEPFTGTGEFKFCITTDEDGYLWCHDGSLREPEESIFIEVEEGIFKVTLGDIETEGMFSELTDDLFQNPNFKYIRVWFNDGINGFQLLDPDIPVLSVPLAINARMLQGLTPEELMTTSSSLISEDQIPDSFIGNHHLSGNIDSEKLSAFSDSARTFSIGNGTGNNITIQANTENPDKPTIRYNATNDEWEFSNNGDDYFSMLTELSGNADTATALAANGTNCAAGSYARGIDASGNAEDCVVENTSLGANGSNCAAGSYARGIDASGNAENCTVENTGTVTSVGTSTGLTGGPVTTSGNISLNYTHTLSSDPTLTAGQSVFDSGDNQGGILFEGAAADIFESLLTVVEPTSDQVLSLPNETGTICTTGSVCAGYQPSATALTTSTSWGGSLNGTGTSPGIANNTVGANQLTSTTVAAGSYKHADLTVDADGRLTVASSGSTIVRKSADETITGSTTFQNDDELFFTIGAGETWVFEMDVIFSSLVTLADFKATITVPANGTLIFSVLNQAENTVVTTSGGTSGTISGDAGSANKIVRIAGSITGSDAGVVRLQWAQAVSLAGNTIVRAGSFLVAHRL